MMDQSSTRLSVLIVDGSKDNREVLKTALEKRGLRTLEAGETGQGLELLRQYHPAVVVLDSEAETANDGSIQEQFDTAAQDNQASLVVLGTTKIHSANRHQCRIVQKPYHYGPLVRTIEELVARVV